MTENNYFLAVAKMLEEISNSTDVQLHTIHNWLCDQENDSELMEAILKKNRTITGAMEYCAEKAQKQVRQGSKFAMVEDLTVFGWVREYFIVDETPKEKRERESKHNQLVKKSKSTEKKDVFSDKTIGNDEIPNNTKNLHEDKEGAIQLDLFGDF
ncbi:TPA: Cas9 inhibitor AcrIIA9 family protein [Streptococcus suis]